MVVSRSLALAIVLAAPAAAAQPIATPDTLPLAQIRDEQQLAALLSELTQDPAIHVDDDKTRPLAQALMTEGVRQLQAQAFDQALANFLEAYARFPSPKILLDVASTLRDMGRLADAANTYQRYLSDPATGAERVTEIKELQLQLDELLTILTIRVAPRGSELSIDGGPFIAVGSSLSTRVRPGLHLIRVRKGAASTELTVNGFEGETKSVSAALDEAPTGEALPIDPTVADHVDGWLITGTRYAADSGTGRARRVTTAAGGEVAAIVRHLELDDTSEPVVTVPAARRITAGVLGVMRIDGKGRGFAGGFGLAYTPQDKLELELAVLRSDVWGGYAGLRVRFSTGWFRPYAAAGMPMFFFTDDTMKSRTAVGGRLAGGVELVINDHLGIEGDLGIEHFFNLDDSLTYKGHTLDTTLFVPTLGVIGRM